MLWAISLSGRPIPMDPAPLTEFPERELGVFALLRRTGHPEPLAMPLASMAALAFDVAARHDVPLFVSHFATCPNAGEHRKVGGAAGAGRPPEATGGKER